MRRHVEYKVKKTFVDFLGISRHVAYRFPKFIKARINCNKA